MRKIKKNIIAFFMLSVLICLLLSSCNVSKSTSNFNVNSINKSITSSNNLSSNNKDSQKTSTLEKPIMYTQPMIYDFLNLPWYSSDDKVKDYLSIDKNDANYYYFPYWNLSKGITENYICNIETSKNNDKYFNVYFNGAMLMKYKVTTDTYLDTSSCAFGILQPSILNQEKYLFICQETGSSICDDYTIFKLVNNKYVTAYKGNILNISYDGKIGFFDGSLFGTSKNSVFTIYFDFESGKYIINKEIIGKEYYLEYDNVPWQNVFDKAENINIKAHSYENSKLSMED